MRINNSTKRAARILAQAYIYAKNGDTKNSGKLLVKACEEGDGLDVIMHGVATSMGFGDDAEASDESYEADATDEAEDDEESDDEVDLTVDDEEDDEEVADEEEEEDEDEDEEVAEEPVADKVEVPASCARMAGMRY